MTPYVYLAVRSDLDCARRVVQASHAAQESGAKFGCPDNCHMVVVEVDGEAGLEKFCAKAAKNGIQSVMFYEPDDDLGHTAACTEPVRGTVRNVFRGFRLLGPRTSVPPDNSCLQQAS